MPRIVETQIESSAGKLDKVPEPSLPEVAFAGRSNVGKSSLLNALTGRRNLFKVGQTPGRTRTIVHARTRLDTGDELYLVDLPGYGFAKIAKGAMEQWGKLIEGYLKDRPTLHLVVLLVDVRRGPEEEEVQLVEFLEELGVPVILVATKLDRLPKNKRNLTLDTLRKELGIRVIGTSAETKDGMDALLKIVLVHCGLAAA